ncbi:MAG TPA: saccharopine dehydrogenase C-terminal domain-containing protein [Terriglobales bacterium]
MRFVVLGAGLMGRAALYDLARSREATEIIVADYDQPRAQQAAREYGNGKSRAAFCDVRQMADTVRLLTGSVAVLNCTQYYWNLEVMKAALGAGAHYLDLGGLFYTTRKQLKLNSEFRRAGLLAILGIGSAPGIANVMARFLADQLQRVTAIKVYNGARELRPAASDPLAFSFSIATILDELTIPPMHYVGGKFRQQENFSHPEQVSFPPPIGKLVVRHSIHSEVATLPLSFRLQGVREVFFKINYDPQMIETVRLLSSMGLLEKEPVAVNGCQVAPRAFLEQLLKSRATGSTAPPRDAETVRVVVEGSKSGRKRRLTLDATTRFSTRPVFSAVARDTGFPISVAAQMLARGEITERGVLPPEMAIPAGQFLKQLDKRGIRITGSGWRVADQ